MRIQRLTWAALSVLLFALSSVAIGQDVNAVSLRPIRPPAGRGLVAADVTVSKNRVNVGEWVTVIPAAPAQFRRPVFSVNFGDGSRLETTTTQVHHKYAKVGHYDIYAWVMKDTPPIGVSLSANPQSVLAKQPVQLNAQLTANSPGIKYRFVFGDRDQTEWLNQSQTVHAYDTAATYLAYVEIGGLENGSFRLLRRSASQPIQVKGAWFSVDLLVNPNRAEVGDRITFTALPSSNDPNASYRFAFGDGAATGWQKSTQAIHQYTSAQKYYAYVEMSTGNLAVAPARVVSGRKLIEVMTPSRVSVELSVNPAIIETERPTVFTARTNSRDSNLKYRFFYGDRSATDWQALPRTRHKYSVAANYFAYVELGLSNTNQGVKVLETSKTIQVTVNPGSTPTPTPTPTSSPSQTPTPQTSPTPTSTPVGSPTPSPGSSPNSSPVGSPDSSTVLSPDASPAGSPTMSPTSSPPIAPAGPTDSGTFPWWYVLIALLVVGGGYWTFKALLPPRPTFSSNSDPGSSDVDAGGKPLTIESQILLKPNIAEGEYLVAADEGTLIQSVRREND